MVWTKIMSVSAMSRQAREQHYPSFRDYVKLILIILNVIFIGQINSFGQYQVCDEGTLFQKYWQYKERFHKTFIVQDRAPSGCINDGIGFTAASSTSSCQFSKQGYGLPATNLMIAPSGWGIPGAAVNQRFDDGNEDPDFVDHDCPGGISFTNPATDPNHKFNWIDYGSETLTQLGWYFVTLATEYELLGRSGQIQEQKKVLEEIFLGIQAIRRLDMQAQCMIKEMYDNRSPGEDLVCDEPYTDGCHRHWDSEVKSDCNFTPDFSGYNGFFIRSDAGQNLADILNDPTDESYNVDAVGGAFSGLNNDPLDECTDVDPFCWMVHTQHIMSHDQLINLFYGFTFLKRYVPVTATVTTCDGQTYKPIEMMQRLSETIVNKINDHGDHITLPGSYDCCQKPVKLSECEGGNLRLTIYGLLKANEYINGPSKQTVMQQFGFEAYLATNESGRSFYLKESCMFKDLSNVSAISQARILNIARGKRKEILLLGNDLLFPSGESMADKVGGKEEFRGLLCSAPCEGPCHVDKGYSNTWPPYTEGRWPHGFFCTNTTGWEGNRWDGEGEYTQHGAPRRTNGLDYMALFNMYMLKYGSGDFYNPKSIERPTQITTYDHIKGPQLLCPEQIGTYELEKLSVPANAGTFFSEISWTSSSLNITDPNAPETEASFISGAPSGLLNVSYNDFYRKQVYFNGAAEPSTTYFNKCFYSWSKNVIKSNDITVEVNKTDEWCGVKLNASISPNNLGLVGNWTITSNGVTKTSTGFDEEVLGIRTGVTNYSYSYTVSTGCGTKTVSGQGTIPKCGNPPPARIQLSPNPANGTVNVIIDSQGDLARSDLERISITSPYRGVIQEIINPDLQFSLNTANFDNGMYFIVLKMVGDTQTVTEAFSVVH